LAARRLDCSRRTNGDNVRMLDKQAVAAALTRVVLPVTYRRGKESLLR